MKITTGLLAIALVGASGAAFAQNAPLSGGATNAPAGTATNNPGTPLLPESTTGTAKSSALDSGTSGAQAAAKTKFEEAGFSNVKGLSRSTDGVWSGRGVKGGVEVGVAMDPSGRITTQ